MPPGDTNRRSCARLGHTVVLILWIIAFWVLLQRWDGPPLAAKFLSPSYWWLMGVGNVILVIFLIVLVYGGRALRSQTAIALAVQLGILVLPLIYLPMALSSQLSSEAIRKRSFYSTSADGTAGDGKRLALTSKKNEEASTESNEDSTEQALASPSLLDLMLKPQLYDGKAVSVTGMVYRDNTVPPNSFLCYRLIMWCCVADARAVGVLVEHEKASELADRDWVTVTGTVGQGRLKEVSMPKIVASQVESTPPPAVPYLLFP
jgi:putative membrane protein